MAKKSGVGTRSWKDLEGSAREEALKKGYNENGGVYMKLGSHYVVTRRDLWRPIIFFIDIPTEMCLLVAAGYFSVLKGDMEAASECFHFFTMLFNMTLISGNLLYYRKIIDDLFTAIGDEFFDYGDTIDPQTKKKMDKYIMDMRVKKKFRFRVFVLVVWILGGSLMIKLIVAYFRFGDTIDGEGGSVSRKHIIPTWLPGLDKWPNYVVMAVMVYLSQVLIMNSIWGFVLPVICFAEELTGQLHIVGIALRHTTARARYIFSHKYGKYRGGDLKSKYAECLREALKASVQHHIVILEACNGMRTLLNLPLMTVMFGTAVLLCMSGFVMVMDTVPIIANIISLLFIGGEVIYAYLFCFYGEMITSTNDDIGNQLYYDKWREGSDVIRPYMAMVSLRCNRPIKLSAGGFSEVNTAAFSNIISSSYSYFNLMFTSKS